MWSKSTGCVGLLRCDVAQPVGNNCQAIIFKNIGGVEQASNIVMIPLNKQDTIQVSNIRMGIYFNENAVSITVEDVKRDDLRLVSANVLPPIASAESDFGFSSGKQILVMGAIDEQSGYRLECAPQ